MDAHTYDMQQCIQNCTNCHAMCLSTIAYCLQQDGEHTEREHLTLLLDCAEICQVSANYMLRGSRHHPLTCGVCAELCTRCAESCEQMNDAQMQSCAEVCRHCAESCQRMATMELH